MIAAFRNSYSCEEFAAEVMDGKRRAAWVRKQCRLNRIKTTARRPFVIPQSEAVRFTNPVSK